MTPSPPLMADLKALLGPSCLASLAQAVAFVLLGLGLGAAAGVGLVGCG